MFCKLPAAPWMASMVALACTHCLSQSVKPVTSTTFNVQDFGAKPDGVEDAQSAVEAAMQAARDWTNSGSNKSAVIYFPRGTYALTQYHHLYAIDIQDLHDVTFEGEDCRDAHGMHCVKLIGAPWRLAETATNPDQNSFFNIHRSQRIAVRNFYLDKQRPYFTQGTVLSVDGPRQTMDIRFDAGYADFTDPVIDRLYKAIYVFTKPESGTFAHEESACTGGRATTPRDSACHNFHILNHTQVDQGTWRVTLDMEPPKEFDQKTFFMWRNVGWRPAFFVEASGDITIENIFYTGGGGSGAHIQANDGDVTVRKFVIDVPPGSGRLFAATSGFNGSRNRGNVTLDQIKLNRTDDDGFHFNEGNYFPALDQSDDNKKVRVTLCYDNDFRPGDKIAAWDWRSKHVIGQATVVSSQVAVDSQAKAYPRTCDVHLDRPLPPLADMRTYDNSKLGRLKDTNARIANLSVHSFLTVTESHLTSMRARCGIIQVSALITHNVCDNVVLAGVLIGPEFSWGEGYAVDGVKVVDNVFNNISGTSIYIADIEDSNESPDFAALTSRVPPGRNDNQDNHHILIKGNTFTDLGRYPRGIMGIRGLAISVENAQDVTITGNHFGPVPTHQRSAPMPIAISPTTTQNVVAQKAK